MIENNYDKISNKLFYYNLTSIAIIVLFINKKIEKK
jgi:hypothetical protein